MAVKTRRKGIDNGKKRLASSPLNWRGAVTPPEVEIDSLDSRGLGDAWWDQRQPTHSDHTNDTITPITPHATWSTVGGGCFESLVPLAWKLFCPSTTGDVVTGEGLERNVRKRLGGLQGELQ